MAPQIPTHSLKTLARVAAVATLLVPTAALLTGAPGPALAASPASSHASTPGKWITYNARTKTAHLTLISAYGQDTYNFDGASNGNLKVKVPAGTTVIVTYSNMSPMMPHGAEVVKWTGSLPTGYPPPAPAFAGAFSPNYLHGTSAGVTQTFTFRATAAGKYLIICPVHNHVKFGHWAWFIVSHSAKRATVTIK